MKRKLIALVFILVFSNSIFCESLLSEKEALIIVIDKFIETRHKKISNYEISIKIDSTNSARYLIIFRDLNALTMNDKILFLIDRNTGECKNLLTI